MADEQQQQQPPSQEESLVLPIIDSHIHLYRECDLDDLHWRDPKDPKAPGVKYLPEFKKASESSPSLLGFVFVETDRNSDLTEDGWESPLDEVEMISRIALGTPTDDDVFDPEDARLCLGIVPWAPVPSGPAALEKYIERVKGVAGEAFSKVKGFRYLVQDKPYGTMLQDDFVESLKYLGRKGYVFEVGVDHRRRGKKQMDEFVALIEKVHDGVPEEEQVTLVIDHLCKPDMTIYNLTSDPNFHSWRTAIYTLSKSPKTYMKLSGAFSELSHNLRTQSPFDIFQSTLGWLGIVLATFGPQRIMFGSDWPVCTFGGGEDGADDNDAWARWRDIVEKMCWMGSLSDEDRAMIFGGTCKKAFNL